MHDPNAPALGHIQNLKKWIIRLLLVFGALFLLGVVLAIVLPDANAPSQSNYEQCLERSAEKAKGNETIFFQLRAASCNRLRPRADTVLGQ